MITEPDLIADRIATALRDVRKEHRSPGWILLGHDEWLALRRYLRMQVGGSSVETATHEPPRFHGYRIAHVDLDSYLEITIDQP